MPKYRAVVVAMARWETESIVEWLTYHRSIGFDHVYLYCNDDDPADLFDTVSSLLSGSSPFLTFLHYPFQGQQFHIYAHFLNNYKNEADWCAFLDIDEFLCLPRCNDVNVFIDRMPSQSESVYFHWVYYGTSGFKERPKGSVLRQYVHREAKVSHQTKTMTRCGSIDPTRLKPGQTPFWHVWDQVTGPHIRTYSSLGEPAGVTFDRDHYAASNGDTIRETAFIAHFSTKSEHDFMRRVERGVAGQFAGQTVWRDMFNSGQHLAYIENTNAQTDYYLRDYWRRLVGDVASTRIVPAPRRTNVALGKRATQSSICEWSFSSNLIEEASRALSGSVTGGASCHTGLEDNPWWEVDLGVAHDIHQVRVYNRIDDKGLLARSSQLAFHGSHDTADWVLLYTRRDEAPFGGADGKPLIWEPEANVNLRYFRITLLTRNWLNLDQVEIYGVPTGAVRADQPTVRSFDLFDTLVARRCVHPHDVFAIVEQRSKHLGFTTARLEAEGRLCSGDYTLDAIYGQMRQGGISEDQAKMLKELELATEFESLFPVKQHCASVRSGDPVISDMYLPRDFLQRIVSDVCQLPGTPLFCSANGKRTGKIWRELRPHYVITEHLGDNAETDVASPRRHHVPAAITFVTQRTEREILLHDHGLTSLAELVREARLTTWDDQEFYRRSQLAQIESNFPLLFLASLHLAAKARERSWGTLLFSSRDCHLWLSLFNVIARGMELATEQSYFFTSRVCKAFPSPAYIRYVQSLTEGRRSVVIDLCGTGWSLQRLIEHVGLPHPDVFLLQHMSRPAMERRYQEVGPTRVPIVVNSLLSEGDNSILEMLNCAKHPMVEDVRAISNTFIPVFSSFSPEEVRDRLIDVHHAAFESAVRLTARLRPSDYLALTDRLDTNVMSEIFGGMGRIHGDLSILFESQAAEERRVWQLLEAGKQRAVHSHEPPIGQAIADSLAASAPEVLEPPDRLAVAPVNLGDIANRFGSDKGTKIFHAHDYTRLYSFLFERWRWDTFSMLEIGLLRGGVEAGASSDRVGEDAPSIRMWLEFFPNAFCYGFDLSDFSHLRFDRFRFYRGDLSSSEDLETLAANLPLLRIIIDDGSHASYHQQMAFAKLFDRVEPGGFYVIEDLHWQPPFEDSLPRCRKTSDVFETFLQTGQLELDLVDPEVRQAIMQQIGNVYIHRSESGGVDCWTMKLVAIQKK